MFGAYEVSSADPLGYNEESGRVCRADEGKEGERADADAAESIDCKCEKGLRGIQIGSGRSEEASGFSLYVFASRALTIES